MGLSSHYLNKPAEKQHGEVEHEGHHQGRDASEEKDKRHETELFGASGKILGEDVAGKEASKEKS